MYKKDLSFVLDEEGKEITYVGWLSSKYEYNRGKVDDLLLYSLWGYLKYKINRRRGFHQCDYCNIFLKKKPLLVTYDKEVMKVGYYDIIVFDKNEKIYKAPSLIFHYIQKHQYYPPLEFINAVYNGVNPNTFEYCQLLNKYGFMNKQDKN